ncbi:MAG: leucine-rich repeat domain-containing protein [Ruminococcaceae bacterium]|nr:leucine-rich repeat domain-containing protein [Oscillospiraceae bacterium]
MSVIYCNECKNVFISEKSHGNVNCPKCGRVVDIPGEETLREKKDEIYLEALHKKKIALYARDLREAKAIFEWLGNYRDASEQVESCEYLAARQEEREKEEMKSLSFTPKKIKRIVMISASILVSLAIIITASLMLVAPIKYSVAESNYEKGNYEKAAEIFSEIVDFKNSKDILADIYASFSEKEGKNVSCSALEPWFSINENGIISFIRSAYTGNGNIVIPDIFDGIKVKSVAANAFKNYVRLKNVALPSELSSIGTYAFYGCKNLESINIPESVISISPYAFKDCSSLKSVNIPDALTVINAYVFSGCSSLEFPTLPDSLTKIDSSAFMGCTSFEEIILTKNIKSIGAFAFSACTNAENIELPVSLTEIGKNAFYECDALHTVYYSGNEEQFKTISVDEGNTSFTEAEIIYVH